MEKLQRDFEQDHLIQWLEQAVVDTLTARPVRMGGTDQLGGRKRTDWCGGDGENRLVGREGENKQREGGGWLGGRGGETGRKEQTGVEGEGEQMDRRGEGLGRRGERRDRVHVL